MPSPREGGKDGDDSGSRETDTGDIAVAEGKAADKRAEPPDSGAPTVAGAGAGTGTGGRSDASDASDSKRQASKSPAASPAHGSDDLDFGDSCTLTTVGLVLQLDSHGQRAFRPDLERINVMLRGAGLPEHKEPGVAREPVDFRCPKLSLPSHWLSYLQRYQAHVVVEDDWEPTPVPPSSIDLDASTSSDGSVLDDPVVEYALSAGLKKHLLGHSSEGYYVPIEMPSGPLYDASGALPGGYLGSSQALMEELIELTPKLGIGLRPLGMGRIRRGGGFDLNEESLGALAEDVSKKSPFRVERLMWFALYEAARLSVKHRTAVVLRSA